MILTVKLSAWENLASPGRGPLHVLLRSKTHLPLVAPFPDWNPDCICGKGSQAALCP